MYERLTTNHSVITVDKSIALNLAEELESEKMELFESHFDIGDSYSITPKEFKNAIYSRIQSFELSKKEYKIFKSWVIMKFNLIEDRSSRPRMIRGIRLKTETSSQRKAAEEDFDA